MKRREFLKLSTTGTVLSTFIIQPDFRYRDVLNRIFTKTMENYIDKVKGEGRYKEGEKFIEFNVDLSKEGVLYRAGVTDTDQNLEFNHYVDFGSLNSVHFVENDGLFHYAEISSSPPTLTDTGINTMELGMKYDKNHFKEMVGELMKKEINEQDAVFSILHKVNRYVKYGKRLDGFEIVIPLKLGKDIPTDSESRILALYKTFSEHFGVDPRLSGVARSQVYNI
ncbi:MAG: hypothetical protein GTN38_01965 [Candidatus Aenigmarchaeota archaeon]|nr:hypothetical protein [Candidatus Aenigmarchaeota archaeon]NIP40321.1 hypothetical protein [Candidatus Aenigmarchaeota archaeon]NIQ17815.1 hypothetical protein [Candidatus Aenigmarchaeota archaeon]NIS73196.1 hypothetical protein [Candidatus Aenigmarchaeota archaeon]